MLVGEKVAIVSPKPQTTRDRILGVRNTEDAQIVFADTPGIYKSRTALSDRMMRTAESSARDVDVILFVHDGHKGVSDEDVSLMKHYPLLRHPHAHRLYQDGHHARRKHPRGREEAV